MLVLKTLGIVLPIVAIYYGGYRLLKAFNQRCEELFGHRVLTPKKLTAMAVACGLLWAGDLWRQQDADWLNGFVVMCLGIGIVGWMAIENYRRTNPLFGTAATFVHIALAPLALQFGIFVALVAVGVLVVLALPRPVYVVNA